jgi:hypothetical protein
MSASSAAKILVVVTAAHRVAGAVAPSAIHGSALAAYELPIVRVVVPSS